MEKRKMSSLMLRILSSLVMVPLVLVAIYMGDPFLNLLMLVVGSMCCWEWTTMVENKNPALYAVIYAVAMVHSLLLPLSLLWVIIVVACAIVMAYKARKEKHPLLLLLGVVYIPLGMGTLMWVYDAVGAIMTLWLILAVWSVDIGGYMFGSLIGGPKLAPKISPKKTWAGLIGGVLLASIVCGGFVYLMGANKNILILFTSVAAALAVIAQIGDLCESAIKRYLGIKDSSNLIPGHGGIFDRIDGLVFATPFFYIFCILMIL
ncbi:MAG: phosphatidate cytidylyltransferase [Alphaproteobacteria bacterium]|nr:phosphatidate cytidylyltransferase [Alphaproteobacteria bacterium]